jgi:cytochrome c553
VTRLALAALPLLASAGVAAAAGAPPGASSCTGCHVTAKDAQIHIPRLDQRPPVEIAGIMREFKSDSRPGTVMIRIAKGFSDKEIDAIAEWLGRHDK